MVEPVRACTRCGSRSEPITTSLVVVDGPMKEACPQLNLCTHCTDSLGRWMDRKKSHRHRSSSGRSHSSRADESMPERGEVKLSDPLDDSPADDLDDFDEPDRRRSHESRSERSRREEASPEFTVRTLLTHPGFLYACLFVMAAVIVFVLLYSLKSGPVEPTIQG